MISDANRAKMDPQVASRKMRYVPGGEFFGSSSEADRTTTSAVFSARSLSSRAMLPSYAGGGRGVIPSECWSLLLSGAEFDRSLRSRLGQLDPFLDYANNVKLY